MEDRLATTTDGVLVISAWWDGSAAGPRLRVVQRVGGTETERYATDSVDQLCDLVRAFVDRLTSPPAP